MVHQVRDVVAGGMCIGCGVCSAATSGAVRVSLGPLRIYQADLEGVSDADLQKADRVCPFSDESPNEDQLAAPHPDPEMRHSEYLGIYTQTFAGRVVGAEITFSTAVQAV